MSMHVYTVVYGYLHSILYMCVGNVRFQTSSTFAKSADSTFRSAPISRRLHSILEGGQEKSVCQFKYQRGLLRVKDLPICCC